jgi:predicted small lipoprotein YifL
LFIYIFMEDRQMKNKILLAILAIALVLAITACPDGGGGPSNPPGNGTGTQPPQ